MKNKLKYGDVLIPYSIIQTKRKKTMQIFIEKDSVEVRAPESIAILEIKKILKNRSRWIFLSQLKLKEQSNTVKLHQNFILYLGKNTLYSLNILQSDDQIIYKKNKFKISIKTKSITKKKLQQMYFKWLLTKHTSYIETKIEHFSKLLNVASPGFDILKMTSKWGSMTVSGKIHLSFHLLKSPKKMIDYVILHELVHMKIKGHRYEFWAYLEKFMPDYKQRKQWLEQNQTKILNN